VARSLPLVLAAVLLVLQARVLIGGNTWDDVTYHTRVAPPRYAAAEIVQSGHVPAWWEGTGLGVPLLGEPSHGAAYPVHWIAGTPRALEIVLLLHLLFAAIGVALWARRLGASDLAAVASGVLAMTTGVLMSSALRGSLPPLAYVPWIAWAASSRRFATLGVLVGIVGLGGELGVLIDAVAIAVIAAPTGDRRRRLGIALACGLAISALQWIPALLTMSEITGAQYAPLPLARFIELFVPGRLGAVEQIGGAHAWFPSVYIGAPLLALAAVSKPTRAFAIFAGVVAIAAFIGRWPGFLGAPEPHLAVLALVAAAHAGVGLDALIGHHRRAALAVASGALLTMIALAAVAILRDRIEGHELLDRALVDGAIAVSCMIAAALVAWLVRSNLRSLILALLVVAPGVLAQRSLVPVTPRAVVDDPPRWATLARTAEIPVRIYRPVKLLEDVRDPSPDTLESELSTLDGTSGSLWGVAGARSEDAARPVAHDLTWSAAAGAGALLLTRYGISVAILPRMNVEGKSHVELAQRGSWALVRFPASPAAAVIYEWIYADGLEAQLRRLFPPGNFRGLDPGLIVIAGRGRENQDEPSAPEPCTIEHWDAGTIDLVCTARDPAFAVVASTPSRGWEVTVDGKAADWVTADVLRRAVSIPQGSHRVQWRYHAPGLLVGAILAALGILALVPLGTLRRSRRSPPAGASRRSQAR
jgi:hypothetical protein